MGLLFAVAFSACRPFLRRRGVPWGAMVVWVVAEGMGVAASGYSFPHHYKQIVPPLALATGMMLSLAVAGAPRVRIASARMRAGLLAIAALALVPYEAVLNTLSGRGPERTYGQYLDVGEWVRDHTRPGDYVFALVNGGIVQTYSERRSPSRYFNGHFITTPAAVAEVRGDLAQRPPQMVVVEGSAPSWLRETLARGYEPVMTRDRLSVFQRR